MSNPFSTPGTNPQPVPRSGGDDTVSVIVPYKNPKALLAYYLGIGAMLPFIGAFPGLAAFILGILGLKERKRRPEIHGSVHAWIGIVLGGGFGMLWAMLTVIVIIAIVAG